MVIKIQTQGAKETGVCCVGIIENTLKGYHKKTLTISIS